MVGIPKKNRIKKIALASSISIVSIGVLVAVSVGRSWPVLDTHGLIADRERSLIYLTVALGMVVVIPVFIMLFGIAWKYRATNTKATYEPEYGGSRLLETLWWGIPCVIILILGIITVVATHVLDPYRPIASSTKPINVEVVALEWRWLFIYPDQGIATLNYMEIPQHTPVNLKLTGEAPMNSFWVPALAGQVYAMSGMSTQLHLMADTTGSYKGVSANLSGSGFADMTFTVHSVTSDQFQSWTKKSSTDATNLLTNATYQSLSQPTDDKSTKTFMLLDNNLYNEIIMQSTGASNPSDTTMQGMGQ